MSNRTSGICQSFQIKRRLSPAAAFLATALVGHLCIVKRAAAMRPVERAGAETGDEKKMSQVVSDLAHELNNPLGVVRGHSAILVDDRNLSGEQRTSVRHILECAEQCEAIIQGMLVVSSDHPKPAVHQVLTDAID